MRGEKMPLKSDILKELETNRGIAVSGESIAKKLGVSRNAVWKAINQLKKDGYEILSSTKRGYRLADSCDLLSVEGISLHLLDKYKSLAVFLHREVDSTNNEAKKMVASGISDNALVISEKQTAGRGRQGRAFYSPEKTGVYMSLVIHPTLNINDSVFITTAACVATVRAIEALTDAKPQIKWVNDIYLDNKKLCGILTEAVTDFETNSVQSIVIGIGINIRTANFPKEIDTIATSLNDSKLTRNRLIAEITNELLNIIENINDKGYLQEYREHSLVLGKEIIYYKNNKAHKAKATSIDKFGGLEVLNENGTTEVLRSGEISVRLNNEA